MRMKILHLISNDVQFFSQHSCMCLRSLNNPLIKHHQMREGSPHILWGRSGIHLFYFTQYGTLSTQYAFCA